MVTFTDPQAYQAAVRPAQVDLLVTTKGDFDAALTRVEFPRVWVQRGRENLPRIAKSAASMDRPPIFFLAGRDQAYITHSSRNFGFGDIAVVGSGSTHHHFTEGPCQWATVSLTDEDLVTSSYALLGCDLIDRSRTQYLRPPVPEFSRLLSCAPSYRANCRKRTPTYFCGPSQCGQWNKQSCTRLSRA